MLAYWYFDSGWMNPPREEKGAAAPGERGRTVCRKVRLKLCLLVINLGKQGIGYTEIGRLHRSLGLATQRDDLCGIAWLPLEDEYAWLMDRHLKNHSQQYAGQWDASIFL